MAFHTPIVVRSETLTIHQGKAAHGIKGDPLKSAKEVRRDRKALTDISNVGKQPLLGVSKGSTLKERSAMRIRKMTKNASYFGFLTEEDVKRCHEWAKEGIEQTHFTGNDLQNQLTDMQEKCVEKKVENVMYALHEWSNTSFGLGMPAKEFVQDIEDVTKLELEPEVLPLRTSVCSTSGNEEIEALTSDPELYGFPSVGHTSDEIKLKEDDADGSF